LSMRSPNRSRASSCNPSTIAAMSFWTARAAGGYRTDEWAWLNPGRRGELAIPALAFLARIDHGQQIRARSR
jgi:hypothetical protein